MAQNSSDMKQSESESAETRARVADFQESFNRLKKEIGKEIVGYGEIVDQVLMCLFARGHVLLEGVPGLGKTLLVRTLARAVNLEFSRIQFTPDLMPADIVGTNVVSIADTGEKVFRFQRGPVFANVLLADEINRATPKTQSALLEAMQERHVTAGGTTHALPDPFLVLGTQNPIEMEGTYPLPEAQLDRFFFKLKVGYLGEEDLLTMIDRTTATSIADIKPTLDSEKIHEMQQTVREVAIAEHVKRYAVRIVRSTQPENAEAPEIVKHYIKFGASPRGIQTLILGGKVRALLDGRFNLACEDIKAVAVPALRHRMILNFEGEAEEKTTDSILDAILNEVPELVRQTAKA
ncbi:MAG: AAA family ATPase [Planctomycetes bacterium]|nr:AAA family ATPase [Planctomycetota bacterium]